MLPMFWPFAASNGSMRNGDDDSGDEKVKMVRWIFSSVTQKEVMQPFRVLRKWYPNAVTDCLLHSDFGPEETCLKQLR